jgi:hypothetical protein
MNLPIDALLLGTGATATMDVCTVALNRWAGIPSPNYRLVGRWVGHMAAGRFRHPAIGAARPMRTEALLGWLTHYAVGIALAAALIALCGEAWLRHPTLAPALAFGLGTVILPFLVMQPAMGLGFAAGRTPDPRAALLRSLLNHLLFGLGLHVAASALALLHR